MKRSAGVTAFGVLFIVFNVLGLLSIFVLAVLGPQIASASNDPQMQQAMHQALNAWRSPLGVLGILASLGGLVSGIGLLALQGWARVVTLVLAGWGCVQAIIGPALQWSRLEPTQAAITVFFILLTLAWNGFTIWFFLRPSVKAQFEGAASTG